MPRKVLITKDTLEEILEKYQGGGSAGSGSGKLYELQFSLDLYDENGNKKDYLSSSFSNPKFICTISENNFERFKQFANAFGQQHGSTITISTINDVVSVINGFNKTQGWQDNALAPDTYYGNSEYTMLSFLFAFADKTLLRVEIPAIQVVYFGQVLSPMQRITVCFDKSDNEQGVTDIPYETDDGVDWYYLGLNTNNSCTLTEYGTSASGGSGTSDVLYKHTITGIYVEGDTQEEDPFQITVQFLSKYADPFVSNGSLQDLITYYSGKNDIQAILQPSLIQDNIPSFVNNIIPTGTSVVLVCGYGNQNVLFPCNFSRNTSGITDTVEPYIQVSGGSSSSESNANLFHINYEVQSNDGAFLVDKIYACSKQTYYSVANSAFQGIASQLSITLPTVTDASSFNSAITTLVPYLNSVQALRYGVFAYLLNIEDICLKASYRQNLSSTNTNATLLQFDRDDYGINVYYFADNGSLKEVRNDTIVADIVTNGNIVGMQVLELNN